MQNSKCPICRRQAEKFLNIKIEGVNEALEDGEQADNSSFNR